MSFSTEYLSLCGWQKNFVLVFNSNDEMRTNQYTSSLVPCFRFTVCCMMSMVLTPSTTCCWSYVNWKCIVATHLTPIHTIQEKERRTIVYTHIRCVFVSLFLLLRFIRLSLNCILCCAVYLWHIRSTCTTEEAPNKMFFWCVLYGNDDWHKCVLCKVIKLLSKLVEILFHPLSVSFCFIFTKYYILMTAWTRSSTATVHDASNIQSIQ